MSPRLDEARCCPSWQALFLRRSACYCCQHGDGDDVRRLLRGYPVVRKRPPHVKVRERDDLVRDAPPRPGGAKRLAYKRRVLLRVLLHPTAQRRDALLLAARNLDLACAALVHRKALADDDVYTRFQRRSSLEHFRRGG